jgi:hypothetical protein
VALTVAPDHVVYAAPRLDETVDDLSKQLGVRATPGGRHQGLGTHNALLGLGAGAYLDIIAPDPDQPDPQRRRPFGLDAITTPRLVTWAVKSPDIDRRVERARAAGYDPGPIIPLSRRLPDGTELRWRLTYREELAANGLVPFLIDWGDAPHPSDSAPPGCSLLNLRAEHPQPEPVRAMLEALAVNLGLTRGPAPALIAALQTPNGRIELR